MTKPAPSLTDFEIILDPPPGSFRRMKEAMDRLKEAGIDPTDRDAVQKAYEAELFARLS